MDTAALKGKIKAASKAQSDVAKEIGMSRSRFNAKLNMKKGAEFTLGEVRSLRKVLDINADEAVKIFFG